MRAERISDWFFYYFVPTWLQGAGLEEDASRIRDKPTVENCEQARVAAHERLCHLRARDGNYVKSDEVTMICIRALSESAWGAATFAVEEAGHGPECTPAYAAAASAASFVAWQAETKIAATVAAIQGQAVALIKILVSSSKNVAVE